MSSNWNSTLTPQEVQTYGQFFNAANGGKSAVVNGQEAVTFFARSGIPNEILSDVTTLFILLYKIHSNLFFFYSTKNNCFNLVLSFKLF